MALQKVLNGDHEQMVVESLKTFAAICGSSAAVGTPAEMRFDAACTP